MADEPQGKPQEGEPMQLEGATEGVPEGQVQQPEQQVDLDGLVQTLEKLNIRDAQHLEGIHNTAQAQGSTARELGQARRQLEDMQRELDAMRRGRGQRDPYNDYGEPENQPIDLQSEIMRANDRWYEERVLGPQRQQAEAYWRDVNTVQSSEFFPIVQEEYEAHIRHPQVQQALATGQTSHTNEFNKLVGRKFKDIAHNLKSAASMLKESGQEKAKPPHMEAGQVPPEKAPEGVEAQRQQLRDIHEKSRGTDDDLDAMIKALLPDNDPIVNI
jgi:hypothetical protein